MECAFKSMNAERDSVLQKSVFVTAKESENRLSAIFLSFGGVRSCYKEKGKDAIQNNTSLNNEELRLKIWLAAVVDSDGKERVVLEFTTQNPQYRQQDTTWRPTAYPPASNNFDFTFLVINLARKANPGWSGDCNYIRMSQAEWEVFLCKTKEYFEGQLAIVESRVRSLFDPRLEQLLEENMVLRKRISAIRRQKRQRRQSKSQNT